MPEAAAEGSMKENESGLKITPFMEVFWQDKMRAAFPEHFHDHYVIGCLLRGQRAFRMGGRGGKLAGRQIMIINPGQAHSCRPEGKAPASWLALHFPARVMAAFAGLEGRAPFFKNQILTDEPLLEKLLALAENSSAKDAGEFLSGVCKRAKPIPAWEKSPEAPIGPLHRLAERPGGRISLGDLAQKAGMGKFAFLRKFKSETGMSPCRCLEAMRLNLVKKKLMEGWPISGCAQNFGYCDQSHLTRQFTRSFGFTPGQLRGACLKRGSGK